MSNHRQISLGEITVSQALEWDVFDGNGNLLLRKGFVIQSLSQAESLIARGMFVDKSTSESRQDSAHVKSEPLSVLGSISQVVMKLAIILRDMRELPNANDKVIDLCKMLLNAISMNEDLALASILLNQSSGTYSVRHSVDTAILAILVAKTMGKSEQEILDITAAAFTMNISMIGVQEKLQSKKDPLTPEETALIHRHPLTAIETLFEAGIENSEWLMYILMHHEHEDGTGYPVGTLKSEIPQNAKILSLADGFCARITSRGYKKSTLPSQALRDIFIENTAHTDPTLGAYFVKVLSLYPPGTFVRLKNQEVAVIAHRGLGPKACVAFSLVNNNNEVISNPIKRDTSIEPFTIKEALHPIQASVYFSLKQVWGQQASL